MLSNTDIVVPIFNESATVVPLIERLRASCPGARLIFVDNASTDNTCSLLEENGIVDLIRHESNLGYGSSLLDGMRHGNGRYVVVIDADLEYLPEDVPQLVSALEGAGACYGSRFLAKHRAPPAMQWYRSLGNGLVTTLFNLLFAQRLTDLYTGVRAFRRESLPLDQLESTGFEFVLELSARLVHAGTRISEVPAGYCPRSTGSSKMRHVPEFLRFARRLIRLRWQLGKTAGPPP